MKLQDSALIDIHHHCIPGVDDGPRTLEEAAELCQMAREDGVTTVIATPHVLRGEWQNGSRALLERQLSLLRQRVGPEPRLFLGSEYFFDYEMNEILQSGSGIIPLAGSRYFLVEFAASAIPPLVEQPFYRAQLDGWIPVIAHPERNVVFQSRPELLAALVARGAKAQVTAASISGDFGPAAKRASLRWIRSGLIHFVATDAHNPKRRPPRMSAARAIVTGQMGPEFAELLFERNPQALFDGSPLAWDPELEPSATDRPPGFLGRLRRFIGA